MFALCVATGLAPNVERIGEGESVHTHSAAGHPYSLHGAPRKQREEALHALRTATHSTQPAKPWRICKRRPRDWRTEEPMRARSSHRPKAERQLPQGLRGKHQPRTCISTMRRMHKFWRPKQPCPQFRHRERQATAKPREITWR